ncbi:hypothetical protein PoB_004383800 [Plakobranchus ocellatus]|uniref:Uncharacterized protein n=1 Tax=Plakobranchus ocellatus TaxID=259542 RepID=A0AAV4BCQ5_9GAST|nr:hypothetical protein PoB_004383800 [Plakobranchus ocellatus]
MDSSHRERQQNGRKIEKQTNEERESQGGECGELSGDWLSLSELQSGEIQQQQQQQQQEAKMAMLLARCLKGVQ